MQESVSGAIEEVETSNARRPVETTASSIDQYASVLAYLLLRKPFAYDVTLAVYCSADAHTRLLRDLGIDYTVKAIIEEVRRLHPTWQPLCYVSRSPDDEEERLILKFESGLADFGQKYAAWKATCDWTVELCKELAGRYQLGDWQDLYSKFSVVVW